MYKAVYVTDEDGTHVEVRDHNGTIMIMHPHLYETLFIDKAYPEGSYVWKEE